MKTTMPGVLAAGALLGLALATAGFAQDRHRNIDTDGDSRISAAEFLDAQLQRVDRLSERRDADGGLGQQEASAAIERRAQEQFTRLDANGDGYLTADEAPRRAGQEERRRDSGARPHDRRRG